jgi:hypothetical protein
MQHNIHILINLLKEASYHLQGPRFSFFKYDTQILKILYNY